MGPLSLDWFLRTLESFFTWEENCWELAVLVRFLRGFIG